MIPLLIPHLSAVVSIALLGWTIITVPGNDTIRRMAYFPLILAPIIVTIVSAKNAGPVQLWNIYLAMMFGTQLVLGAFNLLFVARQEYQDCSVTKTGNEKKDSGKNGANPPAATEKCPSWKSIYRKTRFSIDLAVNKRRINHPDQVAHVPAFNRHRHRDGASFIPSRRQFLLYRTTRFVLFYLLLDLLTLQDLEDAETKCAPGQDHIAARLLAGTISLPQFAEIGGMVLAYGVCGVIGLIGCYDFVSVLAVGPGRFLLAGGSNDDDDDDVVGAAQPGAWPPLFGDPRQAYSIRRFWAKFWHQQFRTVLASISGVVVQSQFQFQSQTRTRSSGATLPLLLTRYTRLLIALLISGTLHLNSDRVQGVHPRESGAVRFFFWQFVGIVVEDSVQAAYYAWSSYLSSPHNDYKKTQSTKRPEQGDDEPPAVWARTLGFIWVGTFMIFVAPTWMFPVLRAGQATVVPVSVVRWMVKG